MESPKEPAYPFELTDVESAKEHYWFWFHRHESLSDGEGARVLEKLMDQAQLVIVGTYEGASTEEQHRRWNEFTATMPNFDARWRRSAISKMKDNLHFNE